MNMINVIVKIVQAGKLQFTNCGLSNDVWTFMQFSWYK